MSDCSGVEFCHPTKFLKFQDFPSQNENPCSSNISFEKRSQSMTHLHSNMEVNSLSLSKSLSESSIPISKHFTSITALKQKLMSKLPGKVCKECFYQSIYAQLSRLGIVKPSNLDVLESNKKNEDLSDDETFPLHGERNVDSSKKKSLLRSVSKRSVSFNIS